MKTYTERPKESELKDNQFLIPAHNLKWVNEKLVKYNKRAKKLGFFPFIVDIAEEFVAENETGKYVEYLIELIGSKVVIAGWEIIAYTEVVNGSNIISRFGSGLDENIDLTEYRNKINCEHCHTNVRRLYTYILKNVESGELKQVGTECVKDFVGHDPKNILRYAQMTISVKEFFENNIENDGFGTKHKDYLYIIEYIARTVKHLRDTKSPYVSRTKMREMIGEGKKYADPTADVVNRSYTYDAVKYGNDIHPEDKDYLMAKKVYNFFRFVHRIKGLEKNELNDYLYTIQVLLGNPYVDWRYDGYISSMYVSFLRESSRIKERKVAKKEEKNSTWIGNVGDKIENKKVELSFVTSFESPYGLTYLYKFVDENKNVLVWFSSVNYDTDTNKNWTIKGTIKKHDTYNGTKQTILTRCKMEKS